MFKKNLAVVATVLLFGLSFAQASQEQSEQRRPPKATRYEKFLDRTGIFVLSKSYMIGKTIGFGGPVWAMVAWAPGESDKVYAVRVVGAVLDLDEIKEFEQELDKIIQTFNSFVDKADWSSMRYQSLNGLELNYSGTSNGDGVPQRDLNLTYRGALIASASGSQSLLQLRELRNLTSQAREKLISLGAK